MINDAKALDECRHNFNSLGLQTVSTNPKFVEAIAAIHCTKCGMFRTKILNFRRESYPDESPKES